jgi:hypothetical protein
LICAEVFGICNNEEKITLYMFLHKNKKFPENVATGFVKQASFFIGIVPFSISFS